VLLENEVYILVLYNFIISLYYKNYKWTAAKEGCKYIAKSLQTSFSVDEIHNHETRLLFQKCFFYISAVL
jgi:hypothetical protein